jgi:hypothetical protein
MSELSPLSGVKLKSDFGAVRTAFDPIPEVGHVTAYIHSNRPRTPSNRRVEPATLRRSDPWGRHEANRQIAD